MLNWSQMPQRDRLGSLHRYLTASHHMFMEAKRRQILSTHCSPQLLRDVKSSVSSSHGDAAPKSSQLLEQGARVLVRCRHRLDFLIRKLKNFRSGCCCRPPWLDRCCWSRLGFSLLVETPLCPERLPLQTWLREPEVAGLLGDGGALLLGVQAGHQLGHKTASLLRVQVAHLLGHVDQGVDLLVVALLGPLLSHTASSTDLHRKLLTGGVPHKLARALLDVPES